ncbi:MAG: diguanylate cyclase [Alphaproteobacteria bacterium]|nr:diguanylate cyclase [Alphaproteobacteria bacterium]
MKNDLDPSGPADESLRESTLLQAVINAIPAPIFFKDSEGRYLGCNNAFEAFVGRTRDELVGKSVFELWDKDLAQVYFDADNELYKNGGKQIYEAQVTYADGAVRDVMFHKAVFFAEQENESGVVGAMLDITDWKQAEAELLRRAKTDDLTGLENRHSLFDSLDGAIKRAKRSNTLLAVLAIDLDGFKRVNDNHGHPVGDIVLKSVADRLKSAVRETDITARSGGDEFIIVLEAVSTQAQAGRIAATIVKKIAAPFIPDTQPINIGVSIGIAMLESNDMNVETLIQNADKALYQMKDAGKGGYAFFKPVS